MVEQSQVDPLQEFTDIQGRLAVCEANIAALKTEINAILNLRKLTEAEQTHYTAE
jgi:hypothetical protein